MAHIIVETISPGRYSVQVSDGRSRTSHEVSVPAGMLVSLRPAAGGELSEEALVRRSFEFLLEREPATSILPRFSLDQISHYFPEYRAAIESAPSG